MLQQALQFFGKAAVKSGIFGRNNPEGTDLTKQGGAQTNELEVITQTI